MPRYVLVRLARQTTQAERPMHTQPAWPISRERENRPAVQRRAKSAQRQQKPVGLGTPFSHFGLNGYPCRGGHTAYERVRLPKKSGPSEFKIGSLAIHCDSRLLPGLHSSHLNVRLISNCSPGGRSRRTVGATCLEQILFGVSPIGPADVGRRLCGVPRCGGHGELLASAARERLWIRWRCSEAIE